MLLLIGIFILIFLSIWHSWLLYNLRGHALPDVEGDSSPIITGPSDAMSQKIIDDSLKNSLFFN
jgi:hypothetical protein